MADAEGVSEATDDEAEMSFLLCPFPFGYGDEECELFELSFGGEEED